MENGELRIDKRDHRMTLTVILTIWKGAAVVLGKCQPRSSLQVLAKTVIVSNIVDALAAGFTLRSGLLLKDCVLWQNLNAHNKWWPES